MFKKYVRNSVRLWNRCWKYCGQRTAILVLSLLSRAQFVRISFFVEATLKKRKGEGIPIFIPSVALGSGQGVWEVWWRALCYSHKPKKTECRCRHAKDAVEKGHCFKPTSSVPATSSFGKRIRPTLWMQGSCCKCMQMHACLCVMNLFLFVSLRGRVEKRGRNGTGKGRGG